MKINKLISNYWLLILALIVASILRLWALGVNPPGLTPDETAIGYNAYTIIKTGKDEYGKVLPFIFKSFGEYKVGLYIYLTAPIVGLLGLSEFSTRLLSAISGIVSVYLLYILSTKLFGKKIGIAVAFIASVNPWLIYFSRAAWEANLSLTLTLTAIYFFLKALENAKYLLLSAVFFALTLLTYQGAKFSTAIVLLLLLITYYRQFREKFLQRNIRITVLSALAGFVICLPIISSFFTGQVFRLKIYSIFSYPRPQEYLETFLAEGEEKIGDLNYFIYHTETFNFVRVALGRWFSHFSGKFLFFAGDWENPSHTAPYQGVLLLSDIILLPLALFAIFRKKLEPGHLFIIFWLVLAPLTAALSRDQVNAVRSMVTAAPMVIVLSFGLVALWDFIRSSRYKLFLYLVFIPIFTGSFIYFLDAYFVHIPKHNSNYWRYGYREAARVIAPIKNNYQNIVFEQSFNQPYIYLLFYEAMDDPRNFDPAKYQNQENLVDSQYKGDVGFQEKIDNIRFERIDWQVLKNEHGTLVIASPTSLPPDFTKDANIIREIKYLNGRDIAFEIIEIK